MNVVDSAKILIVEDVAVLAQNYAACLRNFASVIDIAGDGAAALASLHRAPADIVILDVNLPDMSGIDVLRRARQAGLAKEVIVITGEGSMRLAVEAMRYGARDFLVKPFSIDRLRQAVTQAIGDREALLPAAAAVTVCAKADAMNSVMSEASSDRFEGFIGGSPCMQSVYRLLVSAAPSNATVFITGESGVGKEVCAHALHRLSHRSAGPFVVINCAAIPRDLLESEIFGHAKGAFTGAIADRNGAALQANGGTLFLDEVCEMDVALQAKLLRFLQDRQVRRLGEDTPRPADVRIVCATNKDPHAEVAAGRFREDLLYRLHVVPVELPPLRGRERDVLLIAQDLLARFAREDGKSFRGFSRDAEAALLDYHWPGNVRQLQNVIHSVVVLNDGEIITRDMLPAQVFLPAQEAPGVHNPRGIERQWIEPQRIEPSAAARHSESAIKPLDVVIRETIEYAIARCGGSIPKAAAALTVSPSTLYRRIQAWEAEGVRG